MTIEFACCIPYQMVYARAISPQQQLKLTLDPSVFQMVKPVFQVKKKKKTWDPAQMLYMLQTIMLGGFLMSHQKLNALLRWPEKQKSQSATVNIYKISCENWTLHQMNGPSLPQPNRFH